MKQLLTGHLVSNTALRKTTTDLLFASSEHSRSFPFFQTSASGRSRTSASRWRSGTTWCVRVGDRLLAEAWLCDATSSRSVARPSRFGERRKCGRLSRAATDLV